MKKKKILLSCVTCLLMSFTNIANASCSMGVDTLNFGMYNPFQESHTYSSVGIRVNCSENINVQIKTLSIINYNQLRTMENISYPEKNDVLAYQLFIDSPRDKFFGDGNNNTHYYEGINKDLVIYGTLLKKQNVYKGIYKSNLIIEINY